MKKLLLLAFALLLLGSFFFIQNKTPKKDASLTSKIESEKEISAAFEIYTVGTKRVFADPKYHNRSEDVFITADDPGRIIVKKERITWQDFFDTLPSPMKLTKECLTTGTGQQFCTGQGSTLKFLLNDQENPNALDQEIKNGDELIVRFK